MNLNAESLLSDITRRIVACLKEPEKPWRQLKEHEQSLYINRAMDCAQDVVEGAMRIIAAEGAPVVPVRIEGVVINAKQTTAKIIIPGHHPHRSAFVDAAGADCLLVLSDINRFESGELPTPDPDQPGLDLEPQDDTDAVADDALAADDPLAAVPKFPAQTFSYPQNKWAGGGVEPILPDDDAPLVA